MRSKGGSLLCALALLVVAAGSARANAISAVEYDFESLTGAPSATHPDVTASDFTPEPVELSPVTKYFDGSAYGAAEPGEAYAGSIGWNNFSPDDYYGFTVEGLNALPALDTLVFGIVQRRKHAASNLGLSLSTVVDGAETTLAFDFYDNTQEPPLVETGVTSVRVGEGSPNQYIQNTGDTGNLVADLSGLPAADARSFRIYFDPESNNFTSYGVTEVALSVVPEPATMSLLALGGLAAIVRRRPR